MSSIRRRRRRRIVSPSSVSWTQSKLITCWAGLVQQQQEEEPFVFVSRNQENVCLLLFNPSSKGRRRWGRIKATDQSFFSIGIICWSWSTLFNLLFSWTKEKRAVHHWLLRIPFVWQVDRTCLWRRSCPLPCLTSIAVNKRQVVLSLESRILFLSRTSLLSAINQWWHRASFLLERNLLFLWWLKRLSHSSFTRPSPVFLPWFLPDLCVSGQYVCDSSTPP